MGRPHRREHHADRAVTAEAASRGVTVTIVIDFIHILEYAWRAAWSFFEKGEPAAEEWVADQARKILCGKAGQVAAGIRRRASSQRNQLTSKEPDPNVIAQEPVTWVPQLM